MIASAESYHLLPSKTWKEPMKLANYDYKFICQNKYTKHYAKQRERLNHQKRNQSQRTEMHSVETLLDHSNII